jgi:hypothetical protein
MSSHRATNRHPDKPVNTANIKVPDAATGFTHTTIAQPEVVDSARVSSRTRTTGTRRAEALEAVHRAAEEFGVSLTPTIPPVVERIGSRPGDVSRITRNDVEIFFDASHAFRTTLAGVLPEIADKIGKFILAVPYTVVNAQGHPVQMVPDTSAMTPAQAKLAGLVLHRMLPPIADMDIEGKLGPGRGNHIDARQVRITVNTVSSGEGDSTDTRLRAGGRPSAARQIAPITMNLGEIVQQAQDSVGQIDGIDPDTIAVTLPREHPASPDADAPDQESIDEPDQRDTSQPADADRN